MTQSVAGVHLIRQTRIYRRILKKGGRGLSMARPMAFNVEEIFWT